MDCKVDTRVGGLFPNKVNHSLVFKILQLPSIGLFDFDQYYIFYIKPIRTNNESKRNIFDIFIKDFNHN